MRCDALDTHAAARTCYVTRPMTTYRSRLAAFLIGSLYLGSLLGCAAGGDGDDLGDTDGEIASAGAWYHLDATDGLGPATLTVVNGYKVKCPSGEFTYTGDVDALVLPADCGWECQDGLLGLQGESIVKGHFDGTSFVVEAGLDTWQPGPGTYSIYRLAGAPTCAADPCPTGLTAKKVNIAGTPVAIQKIDFRFAADPSYVNDPTRGDDQAASAVGLLASGRIINHAFRVDRVWRLETPRPACEPQQVARAHAYLGDAPELVQYRTVAEAESATSPDGSARAWLVRTAQSPTAVTFTSGLNDLWVEVFEVDTATCAITTIAEH